MRDFNVNYDNLANQLIADYSNHINNVGCIQLIDKPKRINQSTGTGTIIDHIYTNTNFSNLITPIVLCEDISAHLPVYAELRCMPKKNVIKRPFVRKFTREKIYSFLVDLSNKIETTEMRGNNDLSKLLSIMNNLTNQHFPQKMLSRRQYNKLKNPWITPDLLTIIKNKNKLYASYLKNKTPEILKEYKQLRKNAKNTTDTWKYINQLLRKRKPNPILP